MILRADARRIPLADESVQCVVTSPPYFGLRDYGVAEQIGLEATPDAYVAELVAVFREVRRVLRKDGTLWLNLGDSYAGSNMTGGKSSLEHGRRADRMFSDRNKGTVPTGLKHKDLIGIPWRVAFALQADGWWLRQDIIWSKPNPMPESVTDRCTKAHEYLFLLTRSARYYYDAEAIREDPKPWNNGEMRAPKCGPDRPGYSSLSEATGNVTYKKYDEIKGANRRSVWTVTTQPYSGAHFATFPEKLIEPCILAGAPVGGIVLDPFVGSGTVAAVADRLGRRGVGLDLNSAYLGLAARRLADVTPGLPLDIP